MTTAAITATAAVTVTRAEAQAGNSVCSRPSSRPRRMLCPCFAGLTTTTATTQQQQHLKTLQQQHNTLQQQVITLTLACANLQQQLETLQQHTKQLTQLEQEVTTLVQEGGQETQPTATPPPSTEFLPEDIPVEDLWTSSFR